MEEHGTCTIKVNLPGGVVSAGDLYEILLIAENAGASSVRIGNRQQLYFDIPADLLEDLEHDMFKSEVFYEVDNHQYPNIVSSYVTDSIFGTDSWLREGVYKDIFDQVDFKPKLKINLVDSHQTFVPFFTGNFNFITSNISNYWYWYIRFPKTNDIYCWPSLVYSYDIPLISNVAEKIILENSDLFYDRSGINQKEFHRLVSKEIKFAVQPIKESLKLPEFYLPYYEGFNHYGNGKYWLGIYKRNELFPIDLLKDICNACFKTRVGQLYTTPWKSLLIKGINEPDCNLWRNILNKYRLNIRHAYNELNWQLENLCGEGLELKQQLVREFEDADLRTYKLCFAIKTHLKSGLMGSVIIKKTDTDVFDILHTRDFNPNSKEYVCHKSHIEKSELSKHLIELCHNYYDLLIDNVAFLPERQNDMDDHSISQQLKVLYQCENCLSIYDEAHGDETNGIAPGTSFTALDNYVCPVCECEKESYKPKLAS